MANKSREKQVKSSKSKTIIEQILVFISMLRRNTFFRLAVLWLASYLILMSFFLSTMLKNYVYIEIFPRELILPSILNAVTAMVLALSIYWLPWLESYAAKLFSCTILSLFVIGYDTNLQAIAGPMRALVPSLTDTDPLGLVSFVYLILLLALTVYIGAAAERLAKRFKKIRIRDLELGVLVLVAYLFLIPGYSFFRMLTIIIDESNTEAPEIVSQEHSGSVGEKPDIYYIVLDRYTNNKVLNKQFNFDNSKFTSYLKNNNFFVNEQANSNYPYTTMSISSTLNAQYTNELVAPFKNNEVQSRTLYHNLIRQSSVVKALKKEGYKYHAIGSGYGATNKAPLAEIDYMYEFQLDLAGTKKRLRGVEMLEFKKSIYYRFAQVPGASWWPLKSVESGHVEEVRKQLNYLDELAATEEQGGRFIFAHILVPHEPFVFNGDGSLTSYPGTGSTGRPVKEKYTEQLKFINAQLQELIDKIHDRSGKKAVVILNSDEGPYPQIMNDSFKKPQAADQGDIDSILKDEDMREWSDDWIAMKFGIQQAVHIPRATKEDLSKLSSVNLFRIILNRYAGYNLEYLPQCHFGITNGSQNEFNYADITNRLTDNPDSSCQQLESLPSK